MDPVYYATASGTHLDVGGVVLVGRGVAGGRGEGGVRLEVHGRG